MELQNLRPWIGDPPLTEPPTVPGYRLRHIEKPDLIKLSLFGVPLLLVWLFVFPVLVDQGVSITIDSVPDIFRIIVQFLIAVTVTFAAHEGIHGLAVALQGKRPSFGAGPGFFYTTVKEPLSRHGYFAVAIAPAIVISVGCYLLALQWPEHMGWWLAISTINMSGLGGDLWMAMRMIRTPSNAKIVDMAEGFSVYLPGEPDDLSSTAS